MSRKNANENRSLFDCAMQLSICFHKIFYCILKLIFKKQRKHEFIFNGSVPSSDVNAIFAVNHSNMHDIPYICELLSRHCYVLIGKQPLRLIDRIAFIINGTVWVDRKNTVDKKRAVNKMINILCDGANLVMFPEGTWNLTFSKPMLPLYWGIIDIAKKSNKPIVPNVLEYTETQCYISFGTPIKVLPNDNKTQRIEDVKESFATLKWQIWEKYSNTGCNNTGEWEKEVNKRLNEYPKIDLDYEFSVIRNEYDNVTDVFFHLTNLVPNISNVFLYNKRYHF